MRCIDLFCGAAGGWTLGLHRAGWTTVAACEADPWRRAVFSHNWPDVVMFDDVRTLDAGKLAGLGAIDAIVGSPPCQDASTANAKGNGVDGERTGLFFDAVRLVREVRPRWVCFENVPGLRARGYDRVHDALEAAGYAVRPLVVGAWHAGAFHRRNRCGSSRTMPTPRPCSGLRSRGVNQTELERALLPTPRANNGQGGTHHGNTVNAGVSLLGIAKGRLLRTPTVSDADQTAYNSRGELKLSGQLKAMLGTPTAALKVRSAAHMSGRAPNPKELLATPTKRDWRSGKASQATHDRNSRPLSEQAYARGITGTAALLTLVEWMMGFPARWLLDAASAVPVSPLTATRSSLRSPK